MNQHLEIKHAANAPHDRLVKQTFCLAPYQVMNGLHKHSHHPPNVPTNISQSGIISKIEQETQTNQLIQPIISDPSINDNPRPEFLRTLRPATAGQMSVTVTGLRWNSLDELDQTITICNLRADANLKDILKEIGDKGKSNCCNYYMLDVSLFSGYSVPDELCKDNFSIIVTISMCEFDVTAPGGLQISR
jgi:hypothetical protein